MDNSNFDDKYDLSRIIVKPLYFGLGVNVVSPGALLFVCYYINERGGVDNKLGDAANLFFYIFIGLTVIIALLALMKLRNGLQKPLIKRKETFEEDIMNSIVKQTRPVSLMISFIAVLGIIYYFLTGRFTEAVLLVLLSFVVFQLVRPRYGSLRKLIVQQEKFVEEGKFINS